MKNKSVLFAGVFSSLLFFGCEKEEVISDNELPQPARTFISTHFPDAAISRIKREKDSKATDYDVTLNNGFSLDFDEAGDVTDIDGTTNKLPDSVVPAKILDYVKTNYATDSIVGWEKYNNGQDVELGSKLELVFDKDSNFLRLD